MLIKGRYEIREIIGSGGMGRVFKAFDREMGREVAIKAISDINNEQALQLFRREWRSLANLNHANVIEIYDSGEYEENGSIRPFFVMPLLRGQTLGQMLALSNTPLPVEKVVDIAVRVAEGLQAIHELGLVHRDVKPSNIFVLNNNSVKLIDFGIAQLADGTTGLVIGTEAYMSPEQTMGAQCTALSDLFSLSVVCYEALTHKKPFSGQDQTEIFREIREGIPVPAHLVNPSVSASVSKVIAKGMAKRAQHRWASAAEFASMLARAGRNEAIPALDPSRIQVRVDRARDAFHQENFELTRDVLRDIEEAGFVDPQIGPLRRKAEQAIQEREIRRRLDSAQRGLEFEEFELALDEIQWILKISPNQPKALDLKRAVDEKVQIRRIQELLGQAQKDLETHSYPHARQSLESVLAIVPDHPEATQLLHSLSSREEEYGKKRREKDELYRTSRDAFEAKEFNVAIRKMQRVMELEAAAPETSSGTGANFRDFLNEAHQANETVNRYRNEIKDALLANDYALAQVSAKQGLAAFPGHPLFVGLLAMVEEKIRQTRIFRHAQLASQAAQESNLEKRLQILQQAIREFPGNPEIEQWIESVQDRLACVRDVIAKARHRHDQGLFEQAEERMSYMADIYPGYINLNETTRKMPVMKAAAATVGSPAGLGTTQMLAIPSPAMPAVNETAAPKTAPVVGKADVPLAAPVSAPKAPEPANAAPVKPVPVAPPVAPAPPSKPPVAPPKPTTGSSLPTIRLDRKTGIYLGIAGLLVLIGGSYMSMSRNKEKPKTSVSSDSGTEAMVAVKFESPTAGATLQIDGQAMDANSGTETKLSVGTHKVRLTHYGFQSYEGDIQVAADQNGKLIALPALLPLTARLLISADWNGASVKLGDKVVGEIRDNKFEQELPVGTYEILVSKDGSISRVGVEVSSGQMPKVTQVSPGQNTIVASNLGDQSELWTNVTAARTAEGELLERGKPLKLRGEKTLQLMDGTQTFANFAVQNFPQPALMMSILISSKVGTLRVCSNQDKFDVLLDGIVTRLPITQRCMVIAGLGAGEHTVRAAREGFDAELKRMTVKAREEVRVVSELKEAPKSLPLRFTNLIPGTEIRVDGQTLTKVTVPGSLESPPVALGNRKVELVNSPRYKTKVFASVAVGPRSVDVLDGKLDLAPVTLDIQVNTDASIRYRCGGDPWVDSRTKGSQKVECPEGQASVVATKDGFDLFDFGASTAGKGGTTYPIPITLREKAKASSRPMKQCALNDLAAAAFTSDKAGGYRTTRTLPLPCAGLAGHYTLVFTINQGGVFNKQIKKFEWSVAGANFSLDGKTYSTPAGPVELSLEKSNQVRVDIDVSAKEFSQTLSVGGKSVPPVKEALKGDLAGFKVSIGKDAQIQGFTFSESEK